MTVAVLTAPPAPATPAAPAPATDPRAEDDDPGRCPKRWMGKRCILQTGHVGVCRWS